MMNKYITPISCIFLTASALPVMAQDTSAASELAIEHVIVTANKREQSIQEVPMSISAFDKQFFKDSGETNFAALEQYTPSLKIQSGPDSRSTSIRIRGIGSAGSNAGIDPSVGVFIDGVYQGRAGMNIADLMDVERVEVLRGPQGTLYGKNTAAGAINVITSKPTSEFEAEAELTYAKDNRAELRATINNPIGDSGDAIRVSAFAIKGDHLYNNTFNGKGLNDADKIGARAKALFNFDNGELLISADYSKESTDCCALAVIDYNGFSPVFIGTPMTNSPTNMLLPPSMFAALESVTSVGSPPTADPFSDDYWLNVQPSNDVEVGGLSAEWGQELSNNDNLTFINAWRGYNSTSSYDGDFSAYNAASAFDTQVKLSQFSSELRITSPGGETWDYQGGLYGFYSKLDSKGGIGLGEDILLNAPGLPNPDFNPMLPPGPTNIPAFALSGLLGSQSTNYDTNEYETTSMAAFGQLTWNPNDKLSATLGLRITQEKKERIGSQRTVRTPVTIEPFPGYIIEIPLPPAEALNDLAPVAGPDIDYDQTRTDNNVSPMLNVRYFWNDDFMTYASVSKGFKSGGFDQRRERAIDPTAPNGGDPKAGEFDEEEAISYEMGWKSTGLDNRMTFNGTFYFVDYDNFQSQSFDGASVTVTNAGSLESYGAEFDTMFAATQNLTLGTAIGFNKAEYKEFKNGGCTADMSFFQSLVAPTVACSRDLSGQPLDNAPEWTVSSYAQYEREFGNDLMAIARIEHNYVDAFYLDQDLDENLTNDKVDLVNLRLTIADANRVWEATVWGKNVLDEKYYSMGIDIPTVGGYAGVVAPRATYGITLRRNFQ